MVVLFMPVMVRALVAVAVFLKGIRLKEKAVLSLLDMDLSLLNLVRIHLFRIRHSRTMIFLANLEISYFHKFWLVSLMYEIL